jgi:hypothetical protein
MGFVVHKLALENRIPKRVLYVNLETTRPRGRPRNRWKDKVREDGRTVGGEVRQEKLYRVIHKSVNNFKN